MFYTGIGSRETPLTILVEMREMAQHLAHHYTLRSGGADGADSFFEQGADGNCEIFVPWNGFNGRSFIPFNMKRAMETVHDFHPAPHNLSQGAAKLMARNAAQVLGSAVDDSSKSAFVLFYAPTFWTDADGNICDCSGGTGQAVRIAYNHEVPCILVSSPNWIDDVRQITGLPL